MKYFEGTQEEYLKAAADYKKKNNSLSGFTEKVGFFKNSEGETYKVRPKEGGRLSLANIKSYRNYQSKRSAAEKVKTEGEAQYLTELKKQAKAQSESTEAQFVSGGKPAIAEHDVRLASGGSNEYMSISDPEFKVWKDTIEAKAASQFGDKVIVDIDDVSGDVRVIPASIHNKFQPTSVQPGIDIPIGSSIEDSFKKVDNLLEQPISKLVEPLKRFDFSGGGVKLGATLGALPVIGSIFDVGDVQAGVQGYTQEGQTPMQQFGSGLQALSGATGLAAMVPTPASLALGAVSAVSGLGAAAVQSGAVEGAVKAAPAAIKKAREIERILNPVGYSITNELKFIGGQVRLGKIPYFN
jgi:hypothetical protein